MFRPGHVCLTILLLACTPNLGSSSDEEPPELVQARATYARDVEFATSPIRSRYLSRLDALKRALGAKGDARGTVTIQEEIDRVKAEAGEGPFAKFAGHWKLLYANGPTRRYEITADGAFVFVEESGNRRPRRVVHLKWSRGDCLVEPQEGAIERLRITGGKLELEHFNPKSAYPAGAPLTTATGSREQTP